MDAGGVLKDFFDTIVLERTSSGGSLPFRPDNTPVPTFAAQLQVKAADALGELRRIEVGISASRGRGGMSHRKVRQARQVIRGSRCIIQHLSRSAQSAGETDLAAFKKTRAFSKGLREMIRWLTPMMQRALGGHGPILAELCSIASRFHSVVF